MEKLNSYGWTGEIGLNWEDQTEKRRAREGKFKGQLMLRAVWRVI